MAPTWHHGNAAEDGRQNRSWFIGDFIQPPSDIRSTENLEVKWGVHPAGEQRAEWAGDSWCSTLVILVQGEFRVNLTGGEATLKRQGDYVLWRPGIEHTWVALADSVVITVRWRSSG